MKQIMNDQVSYQKDIETYLNKIIYKYAIRKNIYEPLSKIMPRWWEDILDTAVKNVLFRKMWLGIFGKMPGKKYVWSLYIKGKSISELAKEIIKEKQRLISMIYRKNGWGDPYRKPTVILPKAFTYKTVKADGLISLIGLMDFKRKYLENFKRYNIDDTVIDSILEAIYKTIADAFVTGNEKGFAEGVKDTQRTQTTFDTDLLIDIYNNIELANNDLKNIIDKV